MGSRLLIAASVVWVCACGGGSSGPGPAPTPAPTPPPAASSWAISGRVTDAVTGQAVANATLTFTGFPAVASDGSGAWRLEGTGASPNATVLTAAITAPGFVTRETRVEWRPGGRTDVPLSLFPDSAPFSLNLYRMFVRNTLDAPSTFEPLRRWTVNPRFYLNAFNPRTNARLRPSEIAAIEETVRAVVPQVTGGLTVAAFEIDEVSRDPRDGWINIVIVYDPNGDYCGRAFVGADPGRITLNYDRCQTSFCREELSRSVIAHEVAHAMGFWHLPDGIMQSRIDDCSNVTFTEQERLHARLAYSRPVGNRDVDTDPASFQAFTPANTPEISCSRARSR